MGQLLYLVGAQFSEYLSRVSAPFKSAQAASEQKPTLPLKTYDIVSFTQEAPCRFGNGDGDVNFFEAGVDAQGRAFMAKPGISPFPKSANDMLSTPLPNCQFAKPSFMEKKPAESSMPSYLVPLSSQAFVSGASHGAIFQGIRSATLAVSGNPKHANTASWFASMGLMASSILFKNSNAFIIFMPMLVQKTVRYGMQKTPCSAITVEFASRFAGLSTTLLQNASPQGLLVWTWFCSDCGSSESTVPVDG
jgi:hypothetical protein